VDRFVKSSRLASPKAKEWDPFIKAHDDLLGKIGLMALFAPSPAPWIEGWFEPASEWDKMP